MYDWQIYSVFDPDGGGADFAYTDGLWPRHPEVFVWARPVDGDDPGADWALSPRDRGVLLNELAVELLAGRCSVGAQWYAVYDDGWTIVHFALDAAVAAEHTEAHRLDPTTPVCLLRFALERIRVDPPHSEERQAALAGRFAERLVRGEPARRACFGAATSLPLDPLGEGAGPWTVALDALRRAVVDPRVVNLLAGAIVVRNQIDAAVGVAQAAAHATGRTAAFEVAVAAAISDADLLSGADVEAQRDPLWRSALRTHLMMVLSAAYATVVVADLLDAEQRTHGCGWVAALADPGGAQWRFLQRVARAGAGSSTVGPGRPVGYGPDEAEAAIVAAAADGWGADLFRDPMDVAVDLERIGYEPG